MLLDERALNRGNATDGGATKKDLKTLINHLVKEARKEDYPALVLPQFPEISHQKHERDHFTQKEWDSLISKVIDLSDGAAQKDLTPEQYAELPSALKRVDSQRNWVDLYDALCLMWFFHLRLEDIPRLRAEWFRDPKVFLDRGRLLPDGPPLLKERRYLRKDAADQMWRSLQTQGWRPLNEAAWGAAADV